MMLRKLSCVGCYHDHREVSAVDIFILPRPVAVQIG